MKVLTLLLCLGAAMPAQAQVGDFPVVTQYPAVGGVQADTRRLQDPGYDNYSASITDEYAPSQTEFSSAVNGATQQVGVTVHPLNAMASLVENQNQIQVVSNWAIGAALYTVAFPANWARARSYPIVLSGNPTTMSNNYRVYGPYQDVSLLAAIAAQGVIGITSNCGGIESQGISQAVLRSVGMMFDALAAYGGDRQRVITAGFSRGAGTAVTWAANPLNLDYTVSAIFAHALPVSYLELVSAPYATYPELGFLSDLVTNDPRRSSYATSPAPHSLPNAELLVLTGDPLHDVNTANLLIDKLAGKQLVFSLSTQDPFLPLPTGLAFERALTAHNVPHAAVLLYNGGHELSNAVAGEFSKALQKLAMGMAYQAPSGRFIQSQRDLSTHAMNQQRAENVNHLPFSVVFPYRSGRGQPMRIDLCGAPGTTFRICALKSDGSDLVVDVSGQLGADECASLKMPAPLEVAGFEWHVELNGQPMSRALTAVTNVRALLEIHQDQIPHLMGLPQESPPLLVTMGLSELSPQTGEVSTGCPVAGADAGVVDTGFVLPSDAGPTVSVDAGPVAVADAGPPDAGTEPVQMPSCGCSSTGGGEPIFLALLAVLAFTARRRRNR